MSVHPCDDEPDELENTLTLANCFWHNVGQLFQQGSDIAPRSFSGRLMQGAWSFLIMIVMQSYTGALSAYLTTEGQKTSVNSVEELANHFEIDIGMYAEGTTRDFFSDSQVPHIMQMFKRMEKVSRSKWLFVHCCYLFAAFAVPLLPLMSLLLFIAVVIFFVVVDDDDEYDVLLFLLLMLMMLLFRLLIIVVVIIIVFISIVLYY